MSLHVCMYKVSLRGHSSNTVYPYFVKQGLSVARRSPSKLNWGASEPQGFASASLALRYKHTVSRLGFLIACLFGFNMILQVELACSCLQVTYYTD